MADTIPGGPYEHTKCGFYFKSTLEQVKFSNHGHDGAQKDCSHTRTENRRS